MASPNLPFRRLTKREQAVARIAARPSIRALPRKRPDDLGARLIVAWARLAGVL